MTCPVQHGGPITLDPLAGDLVGEGARLRAAGPMARVVLPGDVQAWAVTHHADARALLNDARLSRDPENWGALRRGEIPGSWPLMGLVVPPGRTMLTVDGPEHKRLRVLTAQALTPRRIELLRPRIERLVSGLLDGLDGQDGVPVDLKAEFAFPLPMSVVGELCGLGEESHTRLRELYDTFFSSVTGPEEMMATLGALNEFFTALVAAKHEEPGDDITSALITAGAEGDSFTDEEVIGTIQVLIAAGHETTVNLITHAVRALLTHPDQLELVRSGKVTWDAVVEEALRWSSPTSNFLFRFPTEDIEVGGVTVAEGEAILVSYGALGRDAAQHGETAEEFDVTRSPNRHISFGYGPHSCPGAQLARLEARIALPALFSRYPGLALAVPADELRPYPSVIINSLLTLPVTLG